MSQLRLELAEALRSQGQLQARVKAAEDELDTLRTKARNDSVAIRTLGSERNVLLTKVRDRDEELRGKSKLVEVKQNRPVPRRVGR
jgi:ABC-type phosphate transport system auxiliary subunit